MHTYNYSNYYILDSDIIDRHFAKNTYSKLFYTLLICIVVSIFVFYFDVLIQVFSYYFLGPSLTKDNIVEMDKLRKSISQYVDVKNKYVYECVANVLNIKILETGELIVCKTLTGQQIAC